MRRPSNIGETGEQAELHSFPWLAEFHVVTFRKCEHLGGCGAQTDQRMWKISSQNPPEVLVLPTCNVHWRVYVSNGRQLLVGGLGRTLFV